MNTKNLFQQFFIGVLSGIFGGLIIIVSEGIGRNDLHSLSTVYMLFALGFFLLVFLYYAFADKPKNQLLWDKIILFISFLFCFLILILFAFWTY